MVTLNARDDLCNVYVGNHDLCNFWISMQSATLWAIRALTRKTNLHMLMT